MRQSRIMSVCSLSMAIIAMWASPVESWGQAIETAVRGEAPRVMQYVKDHHYGTVGVLKFAIKKGDHPAVLDAGHRSMPRWPRGSSTRVGYPERPIHQIDIIHDAGASAASRKHAATYRNAAGRRALFEQEYALAWGDQNKRPDAFLTSEVIVAKDMKTMEVIVQLFEVELNPERPGSRAARPRRSPSSVTCWSASARALHCLCAAYELPALRVMWTRQPRTTRRIATIPGRVLSRTATIPSSFRSSTMARPSLWRQTTRVPAS